MFSKKYNLHIWKELNYFYRCLVLIDVEGLLDGEKNNRDHDLKLFALALLNCSIFIFNKIGVMHANSLDSLHLASQIASEFMTSSDEKENISSHFPHLVWTLRDVKKIEIKGYSNPTANNYMEDLLSQDREECRQIKRCFLKRECFAFKFPVEKQDDLENLENTTEDQLRPAFVEETKRLLEFIQNRSKPMKMNGQALSGLSFSSRLTHLLKSIVDKNLNMNNTFQYVEEDTNRKAFEISMEELKKRIPEKTSGII